MPALDMVDHFVDAARDADLAKAFRGYERWKGSSCPTSRRGLPRRVRTMWVFDNFPPQRFNSMPQSPR
jgi:hypothetical protein